MLICRWPLNDYLPGFFLIINHVKIHWQSSAFSPLIFPPLGYHPNSLSPLSVFTLCTVRMQFVILCPDPSLSQLLLLPFASYLEVMTSIRFNIERVKGRRVWIEEEEEICRWASVKCLHVSGGERLLGERSGLPGLWTPFHSVIMQHREAAETGWITQPYTCTFWPRSILLGVILSLTFTLGSGGKMCLFFTTQRSGWSYSSFLFRAIRTPFSAFQLCWRRFSMLSTSFPLHTRAQMNRRLFPWKPREAVALIFQTFPFCRLFEFLINSTWKIELVSSSSLSAPSPLSRRWPIW